MILERYLARQVVVMILLVAAALVGLDLFFQLVNELRFVGRGEYTMNKVLYFLALTAPMRVYLMFPWVAIIGTVVGLGLLASHSELVVMRTAAFSTYRIVWAVLKGASVLTIFVFLIGEGIAPFTERLAQNKKAESLSGGQTIHTAYGFWMRQGPQFIHVKTVQANNQLLGVTQYEFNEHRQLIQVSITERAIPPLEKEQPWRLENIQATHFWGDRTEVVHTDVAFVPNLLQMEVLETANAKHPERLSLWSLWKTIQVRGKNDVDVVSYSLAFWKKIIQPFAILVMVFLGVPFVFGPLRSASLGLRVLSGILLAFIFHTLNGVVAPMAVVYAAPTWMAAVLPTCIFALGGIWLLKRVK